MDPNDISLSSLETIFEYERIVREIDVCDDVESLRNVAKCYIKLYMKIQETLKDFGFEKIDMEK